MYDISEGSDGENETGSIKMPGDCCAIRESGCRLRMLCLGPSLYAYPPIYMIMAVVHEVNMRTDFHCVCEDEINPKKTYIR